VEPISAEPGTLACLTVLYHNEPASIVAMLEAFDHAARIGQESRSASDVTVALGDASPLPVFDDQMLKDVQERLTHISVQYTWFNENTGTSRGQNRLARETESDLVLLYNPDVLPDARALWRMMAILDDPNIGLVEAKQLPVEHPKDYAEGTGLVSWGSGAFSMVPRRVFEEVGGFDEDTFFLYCDDVDLSWRIREKGYEIVHQPAAVVFHDKSLTPSGGWVPTTAERYYSAEAALLLAHKWSRDDIVDKLTEAFAEAEDEERQRALAEFERRRDAGTLAPRRDPENRVGVFVRGNYAPHRYSL